MVVHFHSSGRYDRAPRLLTAAVPHWTKEGRVGTLTEVSSPERRRALRKALEAAGFTLFDGKRPEDVKGPDSAITWLDANWDPKLKQVQRLLSGAEARRQDNPKDVDATEAVLVNEDGQVLYVSVAHLYSSVMDQHGFLDLPRAQDYQVMVERWADHVRAVRRAHRPDGTMIVADWNGHLIWPWFRHYLRQHFPTDLVPAWPADYHGKGTLGPWVYDGTLTDMEVREGPVVTKDTPGDPSDHDDYLERLGFRRR